MILSIDTTQNHTVKLVIIKSDKMLAKKKFTAEYRQAERLLPEIDNFLKANKLSLNKLTGIEVANSGGGFTALRIGVVTANALAYALNIKIFGLTENRKNSGKDFNIVKPIYDKEPNISARKSVVKKIIVG